jgi:NTP pyrophosphatase (non-canonical NTP hydrolase)
MKHQKVEQIYIEAIDVYGMENQIKRWHEEVGELMQAISKYDRKPIEENKDHLAEELIDVKILTEQLFYMVPEEKLNYWFEFKINRLQIRVKEEKEKRQKNMHNALSQTDPKYFELFKMINEIGLNPLNSQMDDLVNLILKQQKTQ